MKRENFPKERWPGVEVLREGAQHTYIHPDHGPGQARILSIEDNVMQWQYTTLGGSP